MNHPAEKLLQSSRSRVETFSEEYFRQNSCWTLPTLGAPGSERSEGVLKTKISMLYSFDAGGKRLRPALVYGALEALAKNLDLGNPAALAVEMIHTYSLIHDDLPSMDNDDLRRGLPTCHVKFGEAQAILAGDGLLTEAFTLLSNPRVEEMWGAHVALRVAHELSVGAGYLGMVGGQAMDLLAEGIGADARLLEQIHRSKTGALIRASVRMGAIIGRATSEQFQNLDQYGWHLGLAFQVADDVLDMTSTSEKLGKTAGKDQKSAKATYPSLMGLREAKEYALKLSENAVKSLSDFGNSAEGLRDLAHFTVTRIH